MAKRTCMETAMSKLNYRMRSKAELTKALAELDYDSDEISETIEELETFGYIDDRRFSEEFIRSSARKNWSSSRILRALREKGITKDMAEEAMDLHLDEEESGTDPGSFDRERALNTGFKMADEQLAKGKEIDDKFLSKVGRRLMSLGYNSGVCYYVIGRIREDKKNTERWEEDL